MEFHFLNNLLHSLKNSRLFENLIRPHKTHGNYINFSKSDESEKAYEANLTFEEFVDQLTAISI